MTKNIFVTGCAGMIGSNICADLVASGYNVIGIDNLWRGVSHNLATFIDAPNFEFRHADIVSDRDWYQDIDATSVVVHTADIVAGINYVFDNEWSIFQKNILINSQIARIVRNKQPEQLIYLGTACSYPQGLQRSIDGSVLQEADKFPADPESGYGWSKLIGEVEFKLAVKNTDTRLLVLDLHNVYGWPCVYASNTSQVMPALIFKALTSTDGLITVWGDGAQGRAFLHVRDVVQAVSKSIKYNGAMTNLMIGPDVCTTIREIAELIVDHPALNIDDIRYDISKPTGDIGRYANAQLAKEEIGWTPQVGLKDGVSELIDRIVDHYARNST